MTPTQAKKRLAALRREIRAERISYGELAELQNLVPYIEPGDVELAEWAGIPEVDFHSGAYRKPGYDASARTAELAAEENAIFAERKADDGPNHSFVNDAERNDPLAGIDNGPCSNFAPDTLAPDAADRDVCTTCFYRAADHMAADGPFAIENWDGSL